MAFRTGRWRAAAAVLALAGLAAPAVGQAADAPPPHRSKWPNLATGADTAEATASLDLGPSLERGRSARDQLADHRRLAAALAGLAPQRPGVVDAYVISIALDSDAVFAREAREAGRVLSRRYDAAGRTLVLAGSDGRGSSALPQASLRALSAALARVAELMDLDEDVLVVYTTGHGIPAGLTWHDGDQGYGLLTPTRLAGLLSELGISNRLLILSACFSGAFVPVLWSDTTAILTAASASRTSFGCAADNDWTFFGDAMVNHALRKPQPLADASVEALRLVESWEAAKRYDPSYPQVSIGARVDTWLKPLEARMPRTAEAPVGRPATRP
ncbi:MAG: peptidase C13 [Alphaproteobacteria bacterium]|nr:peptidase C13 [Alphaproteobacteria bacterium]MBV9371740.1 peptidase C13 [Alphaproteobacteria bacterium]MBV9902516.1 peptidase C13 [Alphaproteobacteria bacterium]